MDNVIRFGVSIEPALLKKFDEMITRKGYSTRSEALGDLIRKSLIDETIRSDSQAPAIGTLTLLYNHHKGNLANQLLHLQHHKSHDILSTMHIHVDQTNCLEIIVLRGKCG